MDKVYSHKDVEEKIYQKWEESGYFTPNIDKKKKPFGSSASFSIILPPPNANAPLHFGHAMYVIEDILIRYHRMKGDVTLWLPGADHAGFETQFVFEQKLKKEGKSRFDYDRETLYKMIWEYVQENRGKMENQLRRLGFSLDWTRNKFTLDKDIIKIVYRTFKKMYYDGLAYRAKRLVNYCTKDGTSFSDLEVIYEERKTPLYYIKYGPFTIATVRPETKFRDTALAVNPSDPRYKKHIGKTFKIPGLLGSIVMKIIPDEMVDPEYGTGIMKVTPAHDPHDFELGQRFNLPVLPIISFEGTMDFSWFTDKKDVNPKYRARAEKYHGKKVLEARKLMIEDLATNGLLKRVDNNYSHRVVLCYKCKTPIEPLPMDQWFIKTRPLATLAINALLKEKVKIFPKRFTKTYLEFLGNIRDWNISRQIVWGIRVPAWRCQGCKLKAQKSKVKTASQKSKAHSNTLTVKQFNNGFWIVTAGEKPEKCPNCGSTDLEQDSDTFDTWFSSAQWPFATLRASPYKNDYDYFYPTSVMETGYDILRWWVARMVMMGIYATGKIPFKHIVLHGLVKDPLGKKMSKSKGNVVDPLELVDKYGADAVRMALVYGNATGNDQSLSYPKLEAARKFTNKLWNMARFITLCHPELDSGSKSSSIEMPKQVRHDTQTLLKMAKHRNDKLMIKKTEMSIRKVSKDLDSYNFNYAAERLYDFAWHEFADKYIEDVKNRIDENSFSILNSQFSILLKLLHPFMPFVTEEIYQRLGFGESIMIDSWPI